jgi:uncharacterized protein (TIGR03083 family)
MEPSALLSVAEADAGALLVSAEADWGRPVPHCPEWDAAGLVRHTGGIFLWMAAIVASGDRVSRRLLDPAPEDTAALAGWYAQSLERVLTVLASADPDGVTWTFSTIGDHRVRWWCRRLAVEVAIHRWDVQHAAATGGGPGPEPVDGEVAAAGIEEFVIEFLPGLVAQDTVENLAGTLHLHATDGPAEWWVDLGAEIPARAEHAGADTTVQASRSDLLLWLTNRGPLDTVEVLGDQGVAERWYQLRR